MRASLSIATVLAALVVPGLCHPGEEVSRETLQKLREHRDLTKRHAEALQATCNASPNHQHMMARAMERRSLVAQTLREERGLTDKPMRYRQKRSYEGLEQWSGVCHNQTPKHKGVTMSTPASAIFASNATHALTPETIIGPYFVAGELIRRNVTEREAGVPIRLDIQFIDINSCSPVNDLLVDIWHANAAGAYSGVAQSAGGAGLNTTFLRGVQATDADGVVQFDSIFPGHYYGRATHIHVVSRRGGKILPNGTYSGGTVNHVGQLYLDQALIAVVENMEPYVRNLAPLTANRGDFLTEHEATADYDPFLSYVSLTEDANDGLLLWITIGIDAKADHSNLEVPAATYREGGGVMAPKGWNPLNESHWPPGKAPFPSNRPSGVIPGYPQPSFPPPSAKVTPKPWGPCLGS